MWVVQKEKKKKKTKKKKKINKKKKKKKKNIRVALISNYQLHKQVPGTSF